MKAHLHRTATRLALLASLVAPAVMGTTAQAAVVNVGGASVFTGGALGSWDHSYLLGAAGIQVQKIQISLNGDLFFDTTAAAPGFLVSQSVAATAGAGATGFTGFSPSGAGLDGGTSVTLGFGDFDAGELFSHVGDVDEVQTLLSCQGLPLLQAIACNLQNVARVLDGSLVSGAEFAGSTLDVTLGGPALAAPVTIAGTFIEVSGVQARAEWSGTVTTVPAPATLASSLLGLFGLAWVRSRR